MTFDPQNFKAGCLKRAPKKAHCRHSYVSVVSSPPPRLRESVSRGQTELCPDCVHSSSVLLSDCIRFSWMHPLQLAASRLCPLQLLLLGLECTRLSISMMVAHHYRSPTPKLPTSVTHTHTHTRIHTHTLTLSSVPQCRSSWTRGRGGGRQKTAEPS